MSLNPKASQLLKDARRHAPQLDAATKRRVKQAVVLSMAIPSGASASTPTLATKPLGFAASLGSKVLAGVAAAVVAGSGTAGVLRWQRAGAPATSLAQPKRAPVVADERTTERPAPIAAPGAEVAPLAAKRAGSTLEARASEATPQVEPPTPKEAGAAPARVEGPTDAAPPLPGDSFARQAPEQRSLRQELTALNQAMSAHERLQGDEALEALDGYEAQFPSGALRVEARSLRVLVWCSVGQVTAATRLARELRQQHPDAPSVRRLEKSCVGP